MTARIIPVDTFDLVVFGGTGDLALRSHLPPQDLDDDCLARLLARLDYVALDASGVDGWAELAAKLAGADDRVRVFYLATAPDLFGPICRTLAAAQLVTPTARVVLEKPAPVVGDGGDGRDRKS